MDPVFVEVWQKVQSLEKLKNLTLEECKLLGFSDVRTHAGKMLLSHEIQQVRETEMRDNYMKEYKKYMEKKPFSNTGMSPFERSLCMIFGKDQYIGINEKLKEMQIQDGRLFLQMPIEFYKKRGMSQEFCDAWQKNKDELESKVESAHIRSGMNASQRSNINFIMISHQVCTFDQLRQINAYGHSILTHLLPFFFCLASLEYRQ